METERLSEIGVPLPQFFYVGGSGLPREGVAWVAWLKGDFQFDSYDVRSQTRWTGDVLAAAPLLELDENTAWTWDMLLFPARSSIVADPPLTGTYRVPDACLSTEALARLGDTLRRTVSKHHRMKLFRNKNLNAFSHPTERREEFRGRCKARLQDENQRDLHSLRLRFQRTIEGIKERRCAKAMAVLEENGPLDFIEARRKLNLAQAEETLAKMFAGAIDPAALDPHAPTFYLADDVEVAIAGVMREARDTVLAHFSGIEAASDDLETYEIRLGDADLSLYRLSLLWVPETAACAPPAEG